jgi:glycerophosphoryl diester phosphodiesterase
MKLSGVPLNIWDATRNDLAGLDIGSWFAPKFADQRVPMLADVLRACKGKARVNIELKYYGHDQRLEERVVEIVEAEGMTSDVVVMSLKPGAIEKMRALRPTWTLGLLTAITFTDLTRSDADFLAVNAGLATRAFVRSAHGAGKAVHAWTVNDAVTMSALLSRGVDNLITDEPGLGKRVLADRADMSSAERLLLGLADVFGIVPERPQFDPDNPG